MNVSVPFMFRLMLVSLGAVFTRRVLTLRLGLRRLDTNQLALETGRKSPNMLLTLISSNLKVEVHRPGMRRFWSFLSNFHFHNFQIFYPQVYSFAFEVHATKTTKNSTLICDRLDYQPLPRVREPVLFNFVMACFGPEDGGPPGHIKK